MNPRSRSTPGRVGFTLIEILAVIAIIAILIGLTIVAVVKLKGPTLETRTAATLSKIESALEAYRTRFGEYPGGPGGGTKTWPEPYGTAGVALDCWFFRHAPGAEALGGDELDPSDGAYAVDAWRRRLRYRKSGPGACLVWSTGPDGIDQIGTGSRPRAGDDLSSEGVR